TDDPRRLDRPFYRTMPANGDASDAREFEASAVDFEAVTVLFEAEPGESVLALEPRIAWLLACLDAAEEGLERLVQVDHHDLEDVAVDVGGEGIGRLELLDLTELGDLGDRLAPLVVGVLPLGQAGICRSVGTSRART